jgi:hypothetical protein
MIQEKARRIKRSTVPRIPTDLIDEGFVKPMLSAQDLIFPVGVSSAVFSKVAYTQGIFNTSLCWVYKLKWNSKYKIPLPKKVVDLSKPAGEHLLSLLNLCIEFHALGHRLSQKYPHAGLWFLAIANEIKKAQIEEAIKAEKVGKDAKTRAMRAELASLKDEQNPHNPETEPALWSLVEVVLYYKKSRKAPNLIEKLWQGKRAGEYKGFLQAYSGLIHAQESPEYWDIFVKGEKLLARSGRENKIINMPLLF